MNKYVLVASLLIEATTTAFSQNVLSIPPLLSGTTFNLNVQSGSKVFYGTTSTRTFGINGVWLSPTIVVNKGDSITLNVKNELNVKTTMHWHGLHVAAENDGGPHQTIKPNTTWSPSFKIRNNAATYWYHPHGAGQTDPQVSKGLAGLFIVKDSLEAVLNLPRTYGVDDIPLIIQSKAFDALGQIAIATEMDTAMFVNGTLNPVWKAPAQVVRLRLLNGSSLRSFNAGFSNGQSFYQIATDGGLLDTPIVIQRLRLSPGERAEILVNLSSLQGQTIFMKSYASELQDGIYGATNVGTAADTIQEYKANFLNGADFNLLQLNVDTPTANPVSSIPVLLVPFNPLTIGSATTFRTIVMDTFRMLPLDKPNLADGPFGMNNQTFDMDSINEVVHLGTTEVWTLVNKTLVAHPFHIHDIQFNVVERSGKPPLTMDKGWKDVVLVMPNDSIKFISKFETFSDPMVPYMYHCHLLHHEDDGMMGSFLVIDTSVLGINPLQVHKVVTVFPNPSSSTISIKAALGLTILGMKIHDLSGRTQLEKQGSVTEIDLSTLPNGLYFIQVNTSQGTFTKKIVKQ